MRSIIELGNLWPLCKTCNHIAQDHDNPRKNEVVCGGKRNGQCPTCHTWQQNIPCDCQQYVGPTWDEIIKLWTPEEIAWYKVA